MKFNELETVKSLRNYAEKNVRKGDIGAIVLAFTEPNEAYEVEFVNDDGTIKAMFTILPEDIEKL